MHHIGTAMVIFAYVGGGFQCGTVFIFLLTDASPCTILMEHIFSTMGYVSFVALLVALCS